MNAPLITLLIAWLITVLIVTRLDTPLARGFRPRLSTLLGSVFVIGSFFFVEWVRFDFVQYFRLGLADLLRELAPDFVGLLGAARLAWLLQVVLGKAALNGWMLTAFAPLWGPWTQGAITFPSVLALAAFIWLPFGATFSGSRLCKLVGVLLATLSLAALVGLAAIIPTIDALGTDDQFNWALLTVLLGAKLEMGPWLTMLGLALLFVGGLIEIGSSRNSAKVEPSERPWP